MKKRVLAAMMACAMAAGLLSGCSSEPKNPGDSNEPVTTAAAGQTEAGDATAAAQEESGPKIFHDYMTTDVDTINPHIYTMSVSGDVIARTSLQLYRQYPNAEGTSFEYLPELAEKEPCVIVGRCADFILQDRTDCLKVFVHADMKFRADRIVRVYGEREKSPEARLKEKDKRRAAYYRFYTDMKWGDAANYHVALDSGVIGIEKCAKVIESLA